MIEKSGKWYLKEKGARESYAYGIPGEELVMLLRCEALPLYSILERNGFSYRSQFRPDGTNEVRITKA